MTQNNAWIDPERVFSWSPIVRSVRYASERLPRVIVTLNNSLSATRNEPREALFAYTRGVLSAWNLPLSLFLSFPLSLLSLYIVFIVVRSLVRTESFSKDEHVLDRKRRRHRADSFSSDRLAGGFRDVACSRRTIPSAPLIPDDSAKVTSTARKFTR